MKAKYLQAMGITAWRLRPGNPSPVGIRYFQLKSGTHEGKILMVAPGLDDEKKLLEAILLALPAQLKTISEPVPGHYLLMGAELSVSPLAERVSRTHSLKELLENPLLKSKLWLDFCQFFKSS